MSGHRCNSKVRACLRIAEVIILDILVWTWSLESYEGEIGMQKKIEDDSAIVSADIVMFYMTGSSHI